MFILDIMKYKKNNKTAKHKQTNIWGKIPEVEEDKRIMEIMWKLGGGYKEDEIDEEINKLKINNQKNK